VNNDEAEVITIGHRTANVCDTKLKKRTDERMHYDNKIEACKKVTFPLFTVA